MYPLSVKVMTWSLGTFTAITFILCVAYGLVVPAALHMGQLLEMALPGFHWLSAGRRRDRSGGELSLRGLRRARLHTDLQLLRAGGRWLRVVV